MVRNFSELGALVAVCDADVDAATAAAKRHDVAVRPWTSILEDDGVTAVAIATPAATHGTLGLEAVEAGKHVLIEKPLALHVADADAIRGSASARGLTVMVGHLLQYHPCYEALLSLVRGGELGRIRYIYSNRLNFGRFRTEENILWSFAPHDISMILALVGDEPETVDAMGAKYLHRRVADVTTTHLRFPRGEAAHVFVSWLHPYKDHRLVVVGDRGMAVFDDGHDWESKLRVYPHEVEWRDGLPEPAHAEARVIPVAPAEPLRRECQHFLDCLTSGATPRTDADEGLRVLRVLNRAERAMRERDGTTPPIVEHHQRAGVFIDTTAVVDTDVVIRPGTKVWHFSHVLGGSVVGRDCTIGQNVMIGPDVRIGDGCKIQNNVSVYRGVELEDGVFCGPSSVFTNVRNPRAEIDRRLEAEATLVKRGATIGANATIVCGTTVGAYSFVAAGAVLTTDVPDHALMVGVPAKQVGWVSHAGERLGEDLVCPRTGRTYEFDDHGKLVSVDSELNLPLASAVAKPSADAKEGS